MGNYSNEEKDELSSIRNAINKLTFIDNILKECIYFSKDRQEYSNMSLKELSAFYDRVEEGLIEFSLAYKDISRHLSGNQEIGGPTPEQLDKTVSRTLESQLLNIVSTMSIRNPNSLEIQKRLKESPWGVKLKDKDYYIEISTFVFADLDWKVNFYDFLQGE